MDTIGVFNPSTASFTLCSRVGGNVGSPFTFGPVNSTPLIGRWTSMGGSVGAFANQSAGQLFVMRNTPTPGAPDLAFLYGITGDVPIVGDWTGQGYDTVGVYRPSNNTFYLKNSNAPGVDDIAVQYGIPGDVPVVGDWTGQGRDTIGVYRPGDNTFYLKNSNTPGVDDVAVQLGGAGDVPVVGPITPPAPPVFAGFNSALNAPLQAWPTLDTAALSALNSLLGLGSGSVRDQYKNLLANLSGYQLTIAENRKQVPAGTTPAAWQAACDQISQELDYAISVQILFDQVQNYFNLVFLSESTAFTTVQTTLKIPSNSTNDQPLLILKDVLGLIANIAVDVLNLGGAPEQLAAGLLLAAVGTWSSDWDSTNNSNPNYELPVAFAALEKQLLDQFQQCLLANGANETNALQNYGPLCALGKLLESGEIVWTPSQLSSDVVTSTQSYELWLWKTLSPLVWRVWSTVQPYTYDRGYPPQYVYSAPYDLPGFEGSSLVATLYPASDGDSPKLSFGFGSDTPQASDSRVSTDQIADMLGISTNFSSYLLQYVLLGLDGWHLGTGGGTYSDGHWWSNYYNKPGTS